MKSLTRGKKLLITSLGVLICAALLVFALGLPAFTPGMAFNRACQASFLPKLEVQTVLKAKATVYPGQDQQFWLAEKDETVYTAAVNQLSFLNWSAENALCEAEKTDEIWIVPLPLDSLEYDGPHVAVRASGKTASLRLTLGGAVKFDMIPCGQQDGWFLFRFNVDALRDGGYQDFVQQGYRTWLYPSAYTEPGSLHFISYDAAGNVSADVVKEYN